MTLDIAAKLMDLVPFSCAALFLHDAETQTLRCRFATGTDAGDRAAGVGARRRGSHGTGRDRRRALVNASPGDDLEAAGLTDLQTTLRSALACPLVFDDRLIGTLSVYHTSEGFYRDEHRRLLAHVSEQTAAVINNSIRFEQTQEDSLRDPLTGLPNTGFLFMYLTRELARAERLKSELGLLSSISTIWPASTGSTGTTPAIARCARSPVCCVPRFVLMTSPSGTRDASSS